MDTDKEKIEQFIADWPQTSSDCRRVFVELRQFLLEQPGTHLEFRARPGVTFSLRARHESQTEQPLYVMVDVIDTEPRWLSVCFYGRMITDLEELGNYVPGGLLGEDGLCFDIEVYSDELLAYLKGRILEACRAAVS